LPIPFGPSSQEFTSWLFYRERDNDKNGGKNGTIEAQNIDAVSNTYLLKVVGVGTKGLPKPSFGAFIHDQFDRL
jgi:hypothetical protein